MWNLISELARRLTPDRWSTRLCALQILRRVQDIGKALLEWGTSHVPTFPNLGILGVVPETSPGAPCSKTGATVLRQKRVGYALIYVRPITSMLHELRQTWIRPEDGGC
jgi:hypothetical protein